MADLTGSAHSSVFDSLAMVYDAWFEEEGKLIFDMEVKALRGVLPWLPKPWLEVGVGSGRFAQALGIETGIDPSVRLLEMAQSRGITAFVARGEERSFSEGAFGTVLFIMALCFVDSPTAVLREARRILKLGGKIVLGVVLGESPWGKFYQSKKMEGHRFYKFSTFHSYQEIGQMLLDTGFAVEKFVSTLFQKPGEVKEVELPKEGLSFKAGFTVIVAGKRMISRKAAN
jgi:SAM-dependent methyltransferase